MSLLNTVFLPAMAGRQDNYVQSFDRTLNTSDPSFAPRGWSHIVDGYKSPYGTSVTYVSYQQKSEGGYDGGAYLSVGNQNLTYNKTINDLLVTPQCHSSAEISFYAKARNNFTSSAGIKLFACELQDDGSFAITGELTSYTFPALTEEWQKITINLDETGRTYIGIRLNYVDIDEFTISRAWVDLFNELSFISIEPKDEIFADADAQGNFTVSLKAKVKNTGDFDLSESNSSPTEGESYAYTLSLLNHSNGTELASFPLSRPLAIDEESEEEISKVLNLSEYPDGLSVDIRENISNSVINGPALNIVAYRAIPSITRKNSSTELSENSVEYFGVTNTEPERTFTLRNNGAASMRVSAIEIPEGYNLLTTVNYPLDIEAHDSYDFTVKMNGSVVGEKIGLLKVIVDNADNLSLTLHGAVSGADQWHEGFESGAVSDNYINSGWSIANVNSIYGLTDNEKVLTNASNTTARLITPMFEAGQNDAIHFSTAITSESSPGLKVYYSIDRKEWSLIKSITLDAETQSDRLSDELLARSNGVFKRFAVDVPEGQGYIAIDGARILIDDIVGPALVMKSHDFFFENLTAAAEGTVNYNSAISVTVRNVTGNTENAGNYTLGLYVDNKLVTEIESVDFQPNELKQFKFDYTPHTEGKLAMSIKIKMTDGYENSVDWDMNVMAEESIVSSSMGTKDSQNDAYPINSLQASNICESIYPASDIGLKKGARINSLSWKGNTAYPMALDSKLEIWIENTGEESFNAPEAFTATEGMTKIYEGNYDLWAVGSQDKDRIVVKLTDPFIYGGENVRILIYSSNSTSFGFKANAWWQTDQTLNTNTIYSYGGTPQLAESTPVVWFEAKDAANTVSGNVTFDSDGAPAEGVKIKAECENVVYETETDSQGNYTLPIYQKTLNYNLTAIIDGYMPEITDVSVARSSVIKDFRMKVADRIALTEVKIPTEGVVNYPVTAELKVLNPTRENIENFKAVLYLDNKVYAESKPVSLQAGAETTLDIIFYPHSAGVIPAYASVITGDLHNDSRTVEINVQPETGVKLISAGNPEYKNTDVVNYMMNKFGIYEWYYTPEQLGLAKGTKIYSLTLRGYTLSAFSKFNAKLYATNEEHVTLAANNVNPIKTMVNVAEFSNSIDRKGSSAETVDMVEFKFAEPIVYDGNCLHFAMTHDGGGSMSSIYLEMDGAIHGQSATGSATFETATPLSWTSKKRVPVGYFEVDDYVTVSGTVNDETSNAGIIDAMVCYKSGNVEYRGKTDGQGRYAIDVIQKSLDYNVIVKADNHVVYKEDNVTLGHNDFTLVKNILFIPGQTVALVVPEGLSTEILENYGSFYKLQSLDTEGELLTFQKVDESVADMPYLFVPASAIPFDFGKYDISNREAGSCSIEEAKFVGTYSRKALGTDDDMIDFMYDATKDKFVKVIGNEYCPQFCAFISLPASIVGPLQELSVSLWNGALGINEMSENPETVVIYNLQGIKIYEGNNREIINNLDNGLYIIDGRKIIIDKK